nr:transglutaminase domain-containing protein [Bacteroidaceae bacterium]
MKKNRIPFFFILFLILIQASAQKHGINYLQEALQAAGHNRHELECVLNHYKHQPADSLKYRAACYLIENMSAHYTYEGAAVDTFYKVMRTVFADRKNMSAQFYNQKYDSILWALGPALNSARVVKDIETMKSDYLIRNIDEAFEMWQMPWNRKISFELFCEYVLPYRAGKEPLSNWRSLYRNRRPDKLDCQRSYPNSSFLYGLCNELNKNFVDNLYIPSGFMPEFPLTLLDTLKCGSCREYSNQGLAATRACGIPVAID